MKNGEQRVTVLAADVVTIDGEACILTALTDITDRTRLEAESRARRDEAEASPSPPPGQPRQDEFLAMLGHELRNPLGTLTNAVAVLNKMTAMRRRATSSPSSRARPATSPAWWTISSTWAGDHGQDRARRAAGGAPRAGRAVPGRARPGGRTQRHTVTLQGVDLHVDADVTRLEQIVNNLLDNALKYTRRRLRHGADRGRRRQAVLRVRDTGNGIAPISFPACSTSSSRSRRRWTGRGVASASGSPW